MKAVVGTLVLAVLLAVAAAAGMLVSERQTAVATASVLEVTSRQEQRHENPTSPVTVYDLTVAFETEERTVRTRLSNGEARAEVGDTLAVRYDPANPESATTRTHQHAGQGSLLLLAVAVACALAACLQWLSLRSDRRRKQGALAEARANRRAARALERRAG